MLTWTLVGGAVLLAVVVVYVVMVAVALSLLPDEGDDGTEGH